MTVTAPPRPPRPSDPVTHGEFDALVEALIEEARRRGRRRRRRNAGVVTLVTLVGVAVFALLGRSAQSQTASPALSARSSLAAEVANSHIAFISEPNGGGYCGVVYVMNSDGSGQRRLNTGWAAPRDPHSCAQEGDPAWAPDGRQIAISGSPDGMRNWGMYVMNADGNKLRKLTDGVGYESGLAWSPDGQALGFTRFDGNSSEIYVTNADGSGERRLTKDARAGQLAWSPRGDKLAFVSQRDGNLEIYVMNADGSRERRLTHSSMRDSDPAWSPDGQRIAFESNWQVWVMNADGSKQLRLTRNGARNFTPAWSPHGQRIAFERRLGREKTGFCSGCGRAATYQVWSMNANGSELRMLAREAAQPVWSPDGKEIAFARQTGVKCVARTPSCHDIYVMNADGSGQRNLTRSAGRLESAPVWSPGQK